MAKGRERYEKRQRERAKQEKAAAKRERRAGKADGDANGGEDGEVVEEGPSEDELLERFRVLNERHAAGEITDDELEEGRAELMEALGFAAE